MRLSRTIATALMLAVLAAPTPAEEKGPASQGAPRGITRSYMSCSERAGDDVSALGECVTEEKKIQDGLLNKNYATLMSKLQGKAKDDLKASERAWIDFNAKTVSVELAMRGADQTANIETAINELYRYANRADELRKLAFIASN